MADFRVPPELGGRRLEAAVSAGFELSWSRARRLIETGKVYVDGELELRTRRLVGRGATIELRMNSPRPDRQALPKHLIVYADRHVVVVHKPSGVSTIPFGDEDKTEQARTLDALTRRALERRTGSRGRSPLGVVHRLDKPTTGLLVFALTVAAKKHLANQFRNHSCHRRYLALAHGTVRAARHETRLLRDRGDGLRGSAKGQGGQRAVTHVEPVERLDGATLVACTLETGRTHQIRIHMSESGHPLVGESVYIRRYEGVQIPAPRLLLHAAELGFEHPATGRPMRFEAPLPDDFKAVMATLRKA